MLTLKNAFRIDILNELPKAVIKLYQIKCFLVQQKENYIEQISFKALLYVALLSFLSSGLNLKQFYFFNWILDLSYCLQNLSGLSLSNVKT